MTRVLVYFTGFSAHVGGSEFLLFTLIRALQRVECAVTVALQSSGDLQKVSRLYGIEIDMTTLKVRQFVRARQLRQMGPQFDYCISCANPVDFGRPGIHFVHMMTLDANYFNKVWFHDQGRRVPLKMRLSQMRDALLRIFSGARSARQIVRDRREVVLPNSDFVKRSIESYYKCRVHETFYPPTLFEPTPSQSKDLLDIACLGRVGPEKKVLEIIAIVEEARRLTGKNLRLRIVGHGPPVDATYTDYGRRIRAAATLRPWVCLEGVLTGDAKARFLSECRFAIHHCEVEAFGIAVSEYLKAGLVPLVPRAGGSSEVVENANLVFDSDSEASQKLARLVEDQAFYDDCRRRVVSRATEFSAEKYLARQYAVLAEQGIIKPQNLV